ncbi:MAG TPA: hypothetical protein VGI55_00745 [Solirubrobacteraceae bacterium]
MSILDRRPLHESVPESDGVTRDGGGRLPWVAVGIAVLAVAVAALVITRVSPSYDPYGWNVWGYQTLHGQLSLLGAPSWKPVTFMFTLPYSLLGHFSLRLWQVTAAALALGGPVVAGRIAYKLLYDSTGEQAPAMVGAVAAGIGLLVTVNYAQYWLSAQSDPMLVTLFLLWIDMHLHDRPRLAYGALWLCSLGRPEAWPFLGLYAIYLWWKHPDPRTRVLAVVGLVTVPLLWFGVPTLTDDRPFVSSSLDEGYAIQGGKLIGALSRFERLTYWPIKVGALIGVGFAIYKRDWRVLAIAAACALWAAVEAALAVKGYSAAPRYMFEAVAAMAVVAGVGVGWILSETGTLGWTARVGGLAAVLALTGWLVPGAVAEVRLVRDSLPHERFRTTQIERLDATVRALGGYRFVRSCGHPSTNVAYASILAWYTRLNVDQVGFVPRSVVRQTAPAVLFTQLGDGWEVQTYHLPADRQARCAHLNNVYFAPAPGHPDGTLMPHRHLPDSHFGARRARLGPVYRLRK